MPEGPEIRRAADALELAFGKQPLLRVFFKSDLLKPFEKRLKNTSVQNIETRGKALLTHFSNGWTLYSHNQLYGLWQIEALNDPPHASRDLRAMFQNSQRRVCLYSASDLSMHRTNSIEAHPFLQRIGPDVLDPQLKADAVLTRLQSARFARKSLAALLLDQCFIAGLGNYLRSEILFSAGIDPEARALDLSLHQQQSLASEILAVSQRSYRSDGVTNELALTRSGKARVGRSEPGFEQHRFAVFEREGLNCYACDTTVLRIERAGRRLYFCPNCQSR